MSEELTPFEPDPIDPNEQPNAPQVNQRAIDERLNDVQQLKDLLTDLRLNLLTNKIEHGSRTSPVVLQGDDIDTLSVRLACNEGVYIPEGRISKAVRFAAKENAYCPIKRFLLECSYSSQPYEHWDRLGEVLIGSDLEISTKALQRFFIGAVARAYNPGCTMSWVPVLIGKQGCGKSQLLRELVPESLFAEITAPLEIIMKEQYRMHVSWIVELPEIDNFFKPRHIETFKNLITTRVDEVRFPYQSLPASLARRFVMAGTSNKNEFLVDPSGNRRFIPLEVSEGFETPWRTLHEFRNQIWKSAILAYESGEQWEITTGELAQIHSYIQQFAEIDPWEALIQDYLLPLPETTTNDVLVKCLGFAPQDLGRAQTTRISGILTSMGWRRQITKRNGKSVRLWKRPKNEAIGKASLGDF